MRPVLDLTSRIKQAVDIDACDKLAQDIITEQPELLIVYFAELYGRRAALAGVDASADKAIATLLWSASGASHGEDIRVIAEAGTQGPGHDPLDRWRAEPAVLFEQVWTTAATLGFAVAVRAHLLQALWELRSIWKPAGALPAAIDVLGAAVAAHVDAAQWAANLPGDGATRGMLAARHWRTAVRLALGVGKPAWIGTAVEALRKDQGQILDDAPHWSSVLIDVELDLAAPRGRRAPELVSDQRLEELRAALDAIDARLEAMGHMDHVQEKLLDTKARIESFLGRRPDQKEVARRRAQHHERVAGSAASALVASMHWKLAAEEYMQVGLREEGAHAKSEARTALRRAESEGDFQEIVVPIDLSERDHERMLQPFFEGADAARMVVGRIASRLFVPSLESATPRTASAPSIVSQLPVTSPIVDDRSLADVVPGTDEQKVFEERRALVQEIQLASAVVITPLFKKLREDLHLHEDQLAAHLMASPYVDPDDVPFLRVGLERYLRDDHVSALHILVPRVEQMVRRILVGAGVDATALRDGELRERPLGELLRAAEAEGKLARPLVKLLQAVLSEDWGLNLRNRVAHGLLKPDECTQPNVDRVLHIALHLARLLPATPAPVGTQDEEPAAP